MDEPTAIEATFEGRADREHRDAHRTAGRRVWCFACSEWCSPAAPCTRCELPALRAERDALKAATEVVRARCEQAKQDGARYRAETGTYSADAVDPDEVLAVLDHPTDGAPDGR